MLKTKIFTSWQCKRKRDIALGNFATDETERFGKYKIGKFEMTKTHSELNSMT